MNIFYNIILWINGLALLFIMSPLYAQGLPAELRINGKLVVGAFEPQRCVLQASSAVIYTDEKSRIRSLYGVVVSEAGHILTKASEIEGKQHLSLRVDDKLYTDIERLGVDDEWDVALLKVKSDELFTPVLLSQLEDGKMGRWVVSNGSTTRSKRRARVGIVSAMSRAINVPVVLGVEFDTEDEENLKIKKLTEQKGAAKAGLEVGDVLLTAAGVKLKQRPDLLKVLKLQKPGDIIAIELMRSDETLEFDVELMERGDDGEMPMDRNDQMGGGEEQLSKRRTGFARVIQHDTPLTKLSVGGPLLSLDGQCIGMNIARASRVATFAIPARELGELIKRMLR